MKTKIYTSFDKLSAELNSHTFNAPNDNVAKQIVENSFYNQDGSVNAKSVRTAKNYTLVCLGEYDTECGISSLGGDYRTVCEFTELVPESKVQDTNK